MKRINLFIAVLATSVLVNSSSVLASGGDNNPELPGMHTCAVAALQGADITNVIPCEVQASCILYAASGEDGISLKDLMLVCKSWQSLVKDPILNKLFLQESGMYHINLYQYTRAEAEAKLAADLARKPRIRYLTIEGWGTSDSHEARLTSSDIFPSLFLTHGPLRSLRIIGDDYSVNNFIQANEAPNPRVLPAFHLIKELKILEITSITGSDYRGIKRDSRFLRVVIPSLEALEEVAIGDICESLFYQNVRSMPKLRKITNYTLGFQETYPFGVIVTDARVYERAEGGVWKGRNNYDTLILEELNKPDILSVKY